MDEDDEDALEAQQCVHGKLFELFQQRPKNGRGSRIACDDVTLILKQFIGNDWVVQQSLHCPAGQRFAIFTIIYWISALYIRDEDFTRRFCGLLVGGWWWLPWRFCVFCGKEVNQRVRSDQFGRGRARGTGTDSRLDLLARSKWHISVQLLIGGNPSDAAAIATASVL